MSDVFQAKLIVGESNDPLEHEADRVAAYVMRMPDPGVNVTAAPQQISRKCTACEHEDELRRKPIGSMDTRRHETETLVSKALRTPGRPLDTGTRSFFEARLGHDLSSVRLHSGDAAEHAARNLNASAFTVGSAIVFGAGQYAPNQTAGRTLLAHELVHVLQQGSSRTVRRKGPTKPSANRGNAADDPVMEIHLDSGARRVEMKTRSGLVLTGSAVTDLTPGDYWAKPAPKARHWDIQNVSPGLRFWVEMDPLEGADSEAPGPDPWVLSYAKSVHILVSGTLAEVTYNGPSLENRMRTIRELVENRWTGSTDEQRIIGLLEDTPAEQAEELLRRLTDEKTGGQSMLEALDRVIDGENNQRLHEALSKLRLQLMGSEKGVKGLTEAMILPWHDVMGFFEDSATFSVEPSGNGKFLIRYLGGTRLLTSKDFGAEIKSLPKNLFIGGMEFDGNQPIVVHDYDTGRFVPLVVQQLAGYQHAGIRKFIQDVGTVASFAVPVSAARTVLGKAAVFILEKALPALFLIVDENRLNIVKWFPKWGPRILRYVDIAKTLVAVYGISQFAMSGGKFFMNWRSVRNMRKTLDGAVTIDEAEQVAISLEQESDTILGQVDALQKAEGGAGKAAKEDALVPSAAGRATPSSTDPVPPASVAPAPKSAPAVPSKVPEPPKSGGSFDPMSGITDETRKLLNADANQELKAALEHSQRAAQALKRCMSPCYPMFAATKQILRIETILQEAEEAGFSINYTRLQNRLRDPKIKTVADFDKAIGELDAAFAEQKELQTVIAAHDKLAPPGEYIDQTPLARQRRSLPGVADGGRALAEPGTPWLQQGRVGIFPRQIANRMRGMHFANFGEFRETFWQLVAADTTLQQGWTSSNLALMRTGRAPFVVQAQRVGGGSNAVWQLNHIQALEHGGAVYSFDNLEIVTPVFHAGIGQ